MKTEESRTYLNHVTGLRAVAIFLVILFHMKSAWCPQGYYGVDVFLVISGYFLLRKPLVSAEPFRFGSFIKSKLLRLLPPLVCFVAVALGVACLLCPFFEVVSAFRSAFGALCGVSNIFADSSANDYFAADTRSDIFMHLWFMGVMFQAILLFGILFLIWEKAHWSVKRRVVSLMIVGGASLMCYLRFLAVDWGWLGASYLASTYYWTSARLWEFALGGLLNLVPGRLSQHRVVPFLAWGGLIALLTVCFVPMENGTHYLLFAVVCTSLLLIGAEKGKLNSLLSLTPFQWVGTVSFSLYLVHWPLISLTEYIFFAPLNPVRAIVVMVLTLCLGWLLYRYAEKPRFSVRMASAWYIPLLLICVIVPRYDTMPRFSWLPLPECDVLQVEAADSPLWRESEAFVLNRWGKKYSFEPLLQHLGAKEREASFVVLGDSHAKRWAYGLNRVAREQGWGGVYLNSYYHPFYGAAVKSSWAEDFHTSPEKCETLYRWLRCHKGIRFVIIGNLWSARYVDHRMWNGEEVTGEDVQQARTEELGEFCRRIQECGKKVILMADNPHVSCADTMRLVSWKARYGKYGWNDVAIPQTTREAFLREHEAEHKTLRQLESEGCCHVLWAGDKMFRNDVFTPLQDDRVLLSDGDHLTTDGSYWALQLILPELKNLLEQAEESPGQP